MYVKKILQQKPKRVLQVKMNVMNTVDISMTSRPLSLVICANSTLVFDQEKRAIVIDPEIQVRRIDHFLQNLFIAHKSMMIMSKTHGADSSIVIRALKFQENFIPYRT